MLKKEGTYKNKKLLNELGGGADTRIIAAINGMKKVRIGYSDGKRDTVLTYPRTPDDPNRPDPRRAVGPDKGKKERVIIPVAYGTTKSGKPAIRAYQTTGSTRRGADHWKLFLVDRIYSWAPSKATCEDAKDFLISKGLNRFGDKGLRNIYAITPMASSNVPIKKDTNPITSEPVTKTEIPTPEPPANKKAEVTPNKVQAATPTPITKADITAAPKSNAQSKEVDTNNANTLDNLDNKTYFKNKVEAPETLPVTKSDLETNDDNPQIPSVNNNQEAEINAQQNPITKDSLEGEEDTENKKDSLQENKFVSSFNDLMSRMNNLYKDKN